MTQPEFDADLAQAKVEGAQEVARLVTQMHELGLGLAAISGALSGHVSYLADVAAQMRTAAADSREKEPDAGSAG